MVIRVRRLVMKMLLSGQSERIVDEEEEEDCGDDVADGCEGRW